VHSQKTVVYSLEGLTASEMRTIRSGLNRLRSIIYPGSREMIKVINAALNKDHEPKMDLDGIENKDEEDEEDNL
jgi:hypothetical protein